MKLIADEVMRIFYDSLFHDNEPTEPRIEVQGLRFRAGFHPQRLESHRAEVMQLLAELPDAYQEKDGGGAPFIGACYDRTGAQWGEHTHMDVLFLLGKALELVYDPAVRSLGKQIAPGLEYYAVVDACRNPPVPAPQG